MKLLNIALETIRLLQDSEHQGLRSDVLAEMLGTPKRRVYDIIAVLKAMGSVKTHRRFDGTTVTWIDHSKDFVPKSDYDALQYDLDKVDADRKSLQVRSVELKEQVRIAKSKLRRDAQAVEVSNKTEFNTTQLKVRCLSSTGFKRVRTAGLEVIIETNDSGMMVDPTESPDDENEAIIRSLQRI